jgi:hypothetical protein
MPTPLRLAALALAMTAASCASPAESTPPASTVAAARRAQAAVPHDVVVVRTFASGEDLAPWLIAGGEWYVKKGAAYGHQTGDRYAYLTWPQYFGRITSVTVRGSIASPENFNFRVAVGHVSAIFNWELDDVDIYRDGWGGGNAVPHRSLAKGRDCEVKFVQDGDVVRVLVDGRETWQAKTRMAGTVTIYPAVGSTIRIRDVEIRGVPVPWIEIDGPSQRAP